MSNFVKPGLGSVGQYQSSGIPWLKGADVYTETLTEDGVLFEFPTVTKEIVIENKAVHGGGTAKEIMIHFQSNTIDGKGLFDDDGTTPTSDVRGEHAYFSLKAAGDRITLPIRCRRLYVSLLYPENNNAHGHVHVAATLTNIEEEINYDGAPGLS